MNLSDLAGQLPSQLADIVKIFVIFLALVHFIYVAILFQSVYGVTKLLKTYKNAGFLTLILLQLILLAAILVFIFTL